LIELSDVNGITPDRVDSTTVRQPDAFSIRFMIPYSSPAIRMRVVRSLLIAVCLATMAPWPSAAGQESRGPAVKPGTSLSRPPRQVSERPVDIARFDRYNIRHGISVSADRYPDGRGDLPWIDGEAPRYFSSLEFTLSSRGNPNFNAASTPFWSAELPASVDVHLDQDCYVSTLIVRPLAGRSESLEFYMVVIEDDGREVGWSPAASIRLNTPEAKKRNLQGVPAVVTMHPKRARRLRIIFPKSSTGPQRIYISEIRLLGQPAADPVLSLEPATDEERDQLVSGSGDLARFSPADAKKRVRVFDDRTPSGNYVKPWLSGEDKAKLQSADKPYWSAGVPAWAEVTLPKPSIVHRVLVQPLGEGLGVSGFYVKVVTPEGIELDTSPPAEIVLPPVKAPGTGTKPLPIIVDFEPVHAQRLKFYFTQPGFDSGLLYIEDIRVFGIEAKEKQ